MTSHKPAVMMLRSEYAIGYEYGKSSVPDAHYKTIQLFVGTVAIHASCLNCLHFDEPAEQCKKYKVRPPARVIWQGCIEHEDAFEIPF